jgi:hypothetical protein
MDVVALRGRALGGLDGLQCELFAVHNDDNDDDFNIDDYASSNIVQVCINDNDDYINTNVQVRFEGEHGVGWGCLQRDVHKLIMIITIIIIIIVIIIIMIIIIIIIIMCRCASRASRAWTGAACSASSSPSSPAPSSPPRRPRPAGPGRRPARRRCSGPWAGRAGCSRTLWPGPATPRECMYVYVYYTYVIV